MIKINIDKKIKTPKQYSKVWMTRWQLFVMFWLSVFFIADIYFNHCEHLETLCITLVTSIIATVVPFFAKSYFETKQEKLNELQEKQLGNEVFSDMTFSNENDCC